MAENTKIEWCDHTQNFWIGCTKVSPACDGCYAEVSTPSRTLKVGWGAGVPRHRTAPDTWAMPKKWNDRHEAFYAEHDRRQRVFALSLGDWLDNEVPIDWFVDMLDVVRTTLNLDWLLLTKRIGNWRKRLEEAAQFLAGLATDNLGPLRDWIADWLNGKPPANVFVGATIANQPEADRDIPKLLQVPAAKRFLSMEPLLGPVDLTNVAPPTVEGREWHGIDVLTPANRELRGCIDWVIVGGESGPGARPMHPDWARSLRDQCQAAGVSFLFKQWGEWCPRGPESLGYPSVEGVPRFRMTDAGHNGQDLAADGGNDVWMNRVGKKAAGRLLDGRTWDEVPT